MFSSSSNLLEGDLLAGMPLLVQLRDRQHVLLPVVFSALDEVGDAVLDIGEGDARLVHASLLNGRELSRGGLT